MSRTSEAEAAREARPLYIPAPAGAGGGAPHHTLPWWRRLERKSVLSLAKRVASHRGQRVVARLPALGRMARGLLGSVDRLQVEVCGAPFRLDVRRRSVSRSVYLGGRWHYQVVSMLREHVKPGMVALDVGANVGFMAVHMAERAGPDGLVLAFEPEPRNFALLAVNARCARYRNVVPLEVAVGDRRGAARLYLSPRDGGDHRIVAGDDGREAIAVPLTTLDEVARERRTAIHFAKMDIQGAEGAAIRGMERTLASREFRGLVMEFWPDALRRAGDRPEGILETIRRAGLRCASHPRVNDDPAGFVASIPERGSVDLLCLRP
jgi:FkbM family methyltransferase